MTRLAAVALSLFAGLASADPNPDGLWKTIDDETRQAKSLIRITEVDGVFTGTLEKLLDPKARADAVCTQCSDARKGRPIVGMQLIQGVRRDEDEKNRWDGGEILDPKNGKTYRVRLTLGEDGKTLDVRGYLGVPLLGRTQTWIRVE